MRESLDECSEYGLFEPDSPPDMSEILREIRRNAAERGLGGVLVYIGVVKSPVEGRRVEELVYEIHEEYTIRRLREIVSSVKERHSVECLKIFHVRGKARPGDVALVVVAQSVGRKRLYDAVREAVDLVKHSTGIWKLEKREDGVYWVIGEGERIPREAGD